MVPELAAIPSTPWRRITSEAVAHHGDCGSASWPEPLCTMRDSGGASSSEPPRTRRQGPPRREPPRHHYPRGEHGLRRLSLRRRRRCEGVGGGGASGSGARVTRAARGGRHEGSSVGSNCAYLRLFFCPVVLIDQGMVTFFSGSSIFPQGLQKP
jgi:hypothetical protein